MSIGECRVRPSGVGGVPVLLPGLDALLRDGGGVTVERADDGEDNEEIEEPRVVLRRIAEAADIRRPLVDDERSEVPRIRWLYLGDGSVLGAV